MTTNYKTKLLALITIFPFILFAQEQDKKVFQNDLELGKTAALNVAYYGNFITHPGFKLGFDWNILFIEKTKEKKKGSKTVRKLLLLTPSIAFYTHSASHKGLAISTDLAWRRYTKKNYFAEIALGLAYFGRFNAHETWVINDNGTATNIGKTNRSYFAPALSFAFGKHFTSKNKLAFAPFLRVNTNLLMPYNTSILPEFSLELGLSVFFNKGLKTHKVKTITK